jgi:hypothetical protein
MNNENSEPKFDRYAGIYESLHRKSMAFFKEMVGIHFTRLKINTTSRFGS